MALELTNWKRKRVGASLCKIRSCAQNVGVDSFPGDDIVASVSVAGGARAG